MGAGRTTVFALILICSPDLGVAPHAGLAMRPLRRGRCPEITNLPARPWLSFTASLKSSSKKESGGFLRCADLLGHVGYDLRLAQWLGI